MIGRSDLPAVLSPAQLMDYLRTPPDGEWALLDLREEGEAAEGHPFGAVNLPYSRLEIDLAHLIPRKQTPLVLFDGGNEVADRAAARLARLGYHKISVVAGGAQAWQAAELPLFKGVHTFSKAFGEWVQHHFDVPEIGPDQLEQLRAFGKPHALVDGRPLPEHQAFTLPDAVSCPNSDLALRLPGMLAPDMPVVVHCAGRTRSIIGAQTLRDFGLPNPVMALRDGTQGWELSGYAREIGANRPVPDPSPSYIAAATLRARAVISAQGLPTITATTLSDWLSQNTRTTYLLDPRGDCAPPDGFHAVHGTTLIQQTDRFIAVKGARVVLWDPCLVRSTFASLWLTRMGIEAHILLDPPQPFAPVAASAQHVLPPELNPQQLSDAQASGVAMLDMRPAATFHALHLAGAQHALRARLSSLNLPPNSSFVLVTENHARAALVLADMQDMGHIPIGLASRPDIWRAAHLPTAQSAQQNPADNPETVRFCAGRHSGNLDDARTYLAWETGLLSRLTAAGLNPWPKISPPNITSRSPHVTMTSNDFAQVPDSMTMTEDAATFIEGLRHGDIPDEAVRIGLRCILDAAGLYVAGSEEHSVHILIDEARENGGRGDARLLGANGMKVPVGIAARVLGTAGHAHDWDDTQVSNDPAHVYGLLTHPTIPPLTAALTIGQMLGGVDGKRLMTAFQAGVEVESKISEWMLPQHYLSGKHSSGTVGTLGAYAAAAWLLGLKGQELRQGFGIAASFASGIRCNFGTMTKPLHVGRASENGVTAALLAKRGFSADPAALDGPWGFLAVMGGGVSDEKMAQGFGRTWSIVEPGVSIKPYPCGILTHPTMDLMMRLVTEADVKPDEIDTIAIYAGSNILRPIRYPIASNHLEAKFSLPAEVSMIALVRQAGKHEFSDNFVAADAMQAMQRRVKTEFDPAIEAMGFDKVRSRITITRKDGTKVEGWADERYRGGPDNPMTDAEVEAKMRSCCAGVLDSTAQDRLIEAVWNIGSAQDATGMVGLLP